MTDETQIPRPLRHLAGLALVVALAIALYFAWRAVPDLLRLAPAEIRGMLFSLRLPLEVAAAVLIVSGAEWLWARTLDRWLS